MVQQPMDETLTNVDRVDEDFADLQPLPVSTSLMALCWAVLVASGGGIACGWLISVNSLWGCLGLYALGYVGGAVSRKITGQAAPLCGWLQAAAIVFAMLFAFTFFLRFEFEGIDTWFTAIRKLPQFVEEFSTTAAIGVLCTGLGAHRAFRRAGRRYRTIVVMDP